MNPSCCDRRSDMRPIVRIHRDNGKAAHEKTVLGNTHVPRTVRPFGMKLFYLAASGAGVAGAAALSCFLPFLPALPALSPPLPCTVTLVAVPVFGVAMIFCPGLRSAAPVTPSNLVLASTVTVTSPPFLPRV